MNRLQDVTKIKVEFDAYIRPTSKLSLTKNLWHGREQCWWNGRCARAS